jgi:hypothetical protein
VLTLAGNWALNSSAPDGLNLDVYGSAPQPTNSVHDPVLQVLRSRDDFLTAGQIADLAADLTPGAVLGPLGHLGRDFDLEVAEGRDGQSSPSPRRPVRLRSPG